MSDLIDTNKRRGELRWQLLVTVSTLTLIGASVASEVEAANDDTNSPPVWVELGGQLERTDSVQTVFAPPFFDGAPPAILPPMIDSQRRPAYGFGGEGKVIFAPESSDWVFSAAIRYSRSNGARHEHHQTLPGEFLQTARMFFGDGQTEFHESHYVLDFQAGKDVGLGLFGSGSSSIVSAGVRFAQFTSNSNITLHARPDLHVSHSAKYSKYNRHAVDYTAVLQANRSTHAVGPSLAWDASVPLVRRDERATFQLDWGVNASVLFGRQKAQVRHQTSSYHYDVVLFETPPAVRTAHSAHATHHTRIRNVTIPNIGGFAGVSLKFPNAKIALGYRADFFFGATDNGIDTAKKTNVGFYGPFASISIGIGG